MKDDLSSRDGAINDIFQRGQLEVQPERIVEGKAYSGPRVYSRRQEQLEKRILSQLFNFLPGEAVYNVKDQWRAEYGDTPMSLNWFNGLSPFGMLQFYAVSQAKLSDVDSVIKLSRADKTRFFRLIQSALDERNIDPAKDLFAMVPEGIRLFTIHNGIRDRFIDLPDNKQVESLSVIRFQGVQYIIEPITQLLAAVTGKVQTDNVRAV